MPKARPCYPRHVSIRTMDSRERKEGDRKNGGGLAEGERERETERELNLLYRPIADGLL